MSVYIIIQRMSINYTILISVIYTFLGRLKNIMKSSIHNEISEKKLDLILGGTFLSIFFLELIFFICMIEPGIFGWVLVYFISIVTIVIDILIVFYFVVLIPRENIKNETVEYYKQDWIILFIVVAGFFHNIIGVKYISDMVTGPSVVETSFYSVDKHLLQFYDESKDYEFHEVWLKHGKKWRKKLREQDIENVVDFHGIRLVGYKQSIVVTYYPGTLLLKSIRVIDE